MHPELKNWAHVHVFRVSTALVTILLLALGFFFRPDPGYSGSPVFLAIPPAPGPAPRVNPNLPEEIKTHIPELLKMVGYNPKRTTQYQLGPWLLVSTIAISTTKNWCSIARLVIQFRICTCDPIRG